MATNTPKLNLVKPDLGDNVDITELNGNMDILDDALGSVSGILQVVSTVTTTSFSTSSGSPVDITGHTVTITPSSASSTLFVLGQVNSQNSATGSPTYDLQRDSVNVFPGQIITHSSGAILTMALTFSQSAGSTSATTYKLKTKTPSGTLTVRNGTLTVMEVAG